MVWLAVLLVGACLLAPRLPGCTRPIRALLRAVRPLRLGQPILVLLLLLPVWPCLLLPASACLLPMLVHGLVALPPGLPVLLLLALLPPCAALLRMLGCAVRLLLPVRRSSRPLRAMLGRLRLPHHQPRC